MDRQDTSQKTGQLVVKLTSWIFEQAKAAGSKGFVIGISGGIDSSVLVLLCQRAMPENTFGLIMPCHSNPEDEQHARLVADKFSIPCRTVVLDEVYDALLKLYAGNSPAQFSRRTMSNLKARLRMVTLYHFANEMDYMVAGSGNRDELALGYFTKYGDGGVDMLPLGNLVKSEVRDLARYLGVPQPIIDKPPSAGPWPGQTDENEMGITYEELDRYLITGQSDAAIKQRIETPASRSEHKRMLPPIPRF